MDFDIDNYPSWKKLVLIAKNVNGHKTAKEIANIINDLETSKHFRKVLTFLEENNFCEVDRTRNPFLYNIQNKELALFLRDAYPFELAGILIELTKKSYLY